MKLHALFAVFLTVSFVSSATNPNDQAFLQCLIQREPTTSSILYTPTNSSFSSVLNVLIQNAAFATPQTPKPVAVIRPVKESQIQTAIYCGRNYGLRMTVRSGGHDFEGTSYVSRLPFFVLDMFNFQSLSVDSQTGTAWIGVGLSLGQAYYGIYAADDSLALPAGFWTGVGVGGLVSGGGYGVLVREHGLAADNVVDARIIDVNGRILDRKSMGEELFWAIRGGVGSNFAVIISFKVKLAKVPKKVTISRVSRTVEQNAAELIYKWQTIAPKLPLQLSLTAQITGIVSPTDGGRTARADFGTAFRGGADELLSIMEKDFPELNLTREDCHEVDWIQMYPFMVGMPLDNNLTSVQAFLTSRVPLGPPPGFKWKVDFPEKPIPVEGIAKLLKEMNKVPPQSAQLGLTIFAGGAMDTIPESRIPFPHRGKLMVMREIIFWAANDTESVIESRREWVRNLHRLIAPYVPQNPRAAYANYKDWDLGVNNLVGEISTKKARAWGVSYFNNNFDRLIKVKTLVDPLNYLRNEQSIPPLQRY